MKTVKNTVAKETVAKKADPVVHFELPAEDRTRMSKFYNKAFGWKTQDLGEEMNYTLATTTADVDKAGRPKKKGIINGGFFPRDPETPAQYPSVVISVDSVKRTMNKIVKAGGTIIGEPKEIPGFGKYVSLFDTEGNRVSIMEPTAEMKAKTK